MSEVLYVDHNAGFFSCCSVKLTKIIDYFNLNQKEPSLIDCSKQFDAYKLNPSNENEDLTLTYFKNFNNFDSIPHINNVNFFWENQFESYKDILYEQIYPFVEKYFSLSDKVLNLVFKSEQKYNIDYENTISVCYRGNDKHRETNIASYSEFFLKSKEVLAKNPNCKFFVQTDEQEFLDEFYKEFPNTFHLQEMPLISRNKSVVIHTMVQQDQRPLFGCRILQSIYMQSKCKHVITHSGNCGLWIALFRGNPNNISQYLNHKTTQRGWV